MNDPTGAVPHSREVEGLAHVAAVSFLASRLAPSGQFWIALAGGTALARAGARHGLRAGYGASIAAMLETVALIGPARVSGPLTQALNAPLVGRLHGRGAAFGVQFLACLAIRLAHYVVLNALFIWIVVGGLSVYAGSYDKIVAWLGFLPTGLAAAVVVTILLNLAFACFFSAVQVLVYRRALRRWVEPAPPTGDTGAAPAIRGSVPRRVRAVVASAVVAWGAMLASLSWPVLAVVSLLLAAAWIGMRVRDRDALRLGLVLATALALGALVPAVLGVVDVETGGQRAVRAALLVLTATWARAAVGTAGVRALASSALWRLRRVPAAAEGSRLTAAIASDKRLVSAGRSLLDAVRDVPHRPLPVADAVSSWVAAEAARAVPRSHQPATSRHRDACEADDSR